VDAEVDGARRPRLSILVVSWNCAALLERCLEALAEHGPPDCETIVVDNASADGTAARVRARFPGVRLVELPENAGFARGNNVALDLARAPYLLLLNPDTEVRAGSLESLVQFLDARPRAGICAPPLWNPDGSRQPTVLFFPTLRGELLRQTMLYRLLPGRERAEAARTDTRPAEAVSGAALCIRRAVVDAIGPLDPDLFMFYEDVDWCLRAREAGWEVWFVEGPGVVHVKAGASTGAARTRTLLESLRSTVHFFRKHGRASALPALRGIAALAAAARSARALLLWIAGRDRADQCARLAAYRKMLAWAFSGRGL